MTKEVIFNYKGFWGFGDLGFWGYFMRCLQIVKPDSERCCRKSTANSAAVDDAVLSPVLNRVSARATSIETIDAG